MNSISRLSHTLPVLALAGSLGWHDDACAQTFPDRPITMVSPQPAGSVSDLVARALAIDLSVAFKQPVIVDNRPGAGQAVGATLVARAAPNGYTLLMLALPNVSPPSVQKGLPYSGNTDFAAVANVLSVASLLGAGPSMSASNLKDFIALLKANPGKYTWGSAGIGTSDSPLRRNVQPGGRDESPFTCPTKGTCPRSRTSWRGGSTSASWPMSAMQYVPSGKLKPTRNFRCATRSGPSEPPDPGRARTQGLRRDGQLSRRDHEGNAAADRRAAQRRDQRGHHHGQHSQQGSSRSAGSPFPSR